MSRKQRWKTRAIIASVVVAVLVALCWPVWWTSGEGAKTVITVSPGRTAVIGAYDWVAGYVLRHVERPVDAEFPVTATSYPSGPTTAAVIGGRGHGLDCSLPSGASYAFQPQPDRMPIALRFRQACAFHDFCYRHGLATYGYLQNDCDELLQEHAFRICRHVLEKEKEGARIDDCRLEAKKITLAVRLFGSDAFQGWGDSTYYEFDPYPVRTNRFSAARLLTRDADDPGGKGLDLLRFDVVRVGAVVACAACGPQRESAGIGLIGLARSGVFSAPQLVTSAGGRSKLAFAVRTSPSNTSVFLSNATWSSKRREIALDRKSDGLTKETERGSDLLGSTVYAVDVAGASDNDAAAFVTPTVQCRVNEIALASKQVGDPTLRHYFFVDIDGDARLSRLYQMFQHPMLFDMPRQRAVLFKREHDGKHPYQTHTNLLTVDLAMDGRPRYRGRLLRDVALTEQHEPAALLPQNDAVVSLVKSGNAFAIAETALDNAAAPADRDIIIAGQASQLARTWIDRAALMLRDGDSASLLLSRVTVTKPNKAAPDTQAAHLDVALLRRDKAADGKVRWVSSAAARCKVDYRITKLDEARICQVRHADNATLPTMLNRLRGSQTLAGDMRGNGGTDVVIMDPCLPDKPVLLEWSAADGKAAWTPAAQTAHVQGNLSRDVGACAPLSKADMLAD